MQLVNCLKKTLEGCSGMTTWGIGGAVVTEQVKVVMEEEVEEVED